MLSLKKKAVCFCRLLKCFRASWSNSVDPGEDQSDLDPDCLPLYLHKSIILACNAADDLNRPHSQEQFFC